MLDDPLKISIRSELFSWSLSDAIKGEEGEKSPEIENRNLVLFSILASYLIACANHQRIIDEKDDGVKATFLITSGFKEKELPDCNQAFFEKFAELLSDYKRALKFSFSILNIADRKDLFKDLQRIFIGNGINTSKFHALTTSCYHPNADGTPCGRCSKCEIIREEKMRYYA